MLKKLLFVFLVLFTALPIKAQEPEKYPECEFTSTFTAIQEEFNKVTDWQTLENFKELLDSSLAYCIGLYWNDDGQRESTVFGPFTIPAGIYRLVATTDGFIIVDFEPLSEGCDTFIDGINAFEGDAINGTEVIYRNENDCEVLMTVHNVQAPWTVEFRPIE